MMPVKYAIAVLMGFGSGVVLAGATVAFITAIGIVPRLAQKTGTQCNIILYEESIMVGAMVGMLAAFFDCRLPIGRVAVAFMSAAAGIFYGCLAMSLAEVINVIPIMTRRGRVQFGMFYFVLAIAVGKMVGALLYFILPGFFTP